MTRAVGPGPPESSQLMKPQRWGSGFEERTWSRRDVLQTGAAAALGLAAGQAAAAENNSRVPARAKRCIFILCTGGPSQLETWDPKPEAPAEVRGPYGAIETNVSGLRISEILPRLARRADSYSLVRSVHHSGPALHEVGLQLMQTGRTASADAEWPSFGAVLSRLFGPVGSLPASVVLPRPLGDMGITLPQGQGAGFLGEAYAPLAVVGDPNEVDYGVESLLSAGDIPTQSRGGRRERLNALLGHEPVSSVPVGLDTDPHYELMASPQARTAFDLSREAESLRDRYGRNSFGQSCLLARRLLEHGTRFVTINQFDSVFHQHTWDCHGYPDLPTRVADLKERVAAPFDQAVSALLDDLTSRGLYEDTLLCCFGELGRTPTLTATGGRDHWTRCWSVMLGGGGLRGGQVVGASDAHASEPTERPISPAMLAATVYTALGVAPDTRLAGADGHLRTLLPRGTEALSELI